MTYMSTVVISHVENGSPVNILLLYQLPVNGLSLHF